MKTAILIICAAALGASAPAVAAKQGDPDQPQVSYDKKTGQYCVSQEVTGHWMPVKDCRTQEAWAKAGVNFSRSPDDKLASK